MTEGEGEEMHALYPLKESSKVQDTALDHLATHGESALDIYQLWAKRDGE